jgi:hypothetical protein
VGEVKDRHKEYEKSAKNRKVKKEAWFLQQLPGSSTLIVFMEADDAGKSVTDLAQSIDSFDVWLKDSAKTITGMDFSQPRRDPFPELLMSHGF